MVGVGGGGLGGAGLVGVEVERLAREEEGLARLKRDGIVDVAEGVVYRW